MTAGAILAILAAAVLAIELATMTFYLIAVAAALGAGSIAAFAGDSAGMAIVVVVIAALVGLPAATIVRRRLLRPRPEWAQVACPDVGQLVRVETISAEGLRVAYRDTSWQARLESPSAAPPAIGDILTIVDRQGSELILASPAAAQDIKQPQR